MRNTGTALDRGRQTTTEAVRVGKIPLPTFRQYTKQFDPRDFVRLTAAYHLDSSFTESINTAVYLTLRNGTRRQSLNPAAATMVDQRMRQLCLLNGTTHSAWEAEVCFDLALYDNAYLHRRESRSTQLSPGRQRATAFYDPLPAEAVRLDIDGDGRLYQVRLEAELGYGDEVFDPREVIHLWTIRQTGQIYAWPMMYPALEDLSILRYLENQTGGMIHKNLNPMLHAMVGVNRPIQPEPQELDDVEDKLRNLDPHNAFVVTEGDVDMKMLGAESRALRMEGLLKFFRERSRDGLSLSRDTVRQPLSKAIERRVEFLRTALCRLDTTVYTEMLLREGINPIDIPDNMVQTIFHPVDLDAVVKGENHLNNLWIADFMGLNEGRLKAGLPVVDDIRPGSLDDLRFRRVVSGDVSLNGIANTDSPQNQHPKD